MISLVEAKPGQGKSIYATYHIIEYLAFKRRTRICTNMPLNLPPGALARITHVSDWRDIKSVMYEHLARSSRDRKSEGSLLFVLDELSLLLDANNWDSLPMDVKFMLRQHRKFGVDILGFSQSVRDIDVKYRRLVQRLYVIKKVFVLPFLKWPIGLFYLREYDSDDVDKERVDRVPLNLLFHPPEIVLATPHVFRSSDSWAIFEIPNAGQKIVEHVNVVCAQHGKDCVHLPVSRRVVHQ